MKFTKLFLTLAAWIFVSYASGAGAAPAKDKADDLCDVAEGNGFTGILHALSYEFEDGDDSRVLVEVSKAEYDGARCVLLKAKRRYQSFIVQDSYLRIVRLRLDQKSGDIVGYDLWTGSAIMLRHQNDPKPFDY